MKEISQELESFYDFVIKEINSVRSSDDNDTYKITTDKGIFFGRLSKRKNKNSIETDLELKFLEYLKLNRFPVAAAILTKNGKNHEYIGGRVVTIFEWINGNSGSVSKGDYLSLEKVYNAGKVLAALHNVSVAYNCECKLSRILTTEFERIIDFQDDVLKKYSNGGALIKTIAQMIEFDRGYSRQQRIIIHNDFRPQNILFSSDEKSKDDIVGVVDFDWMCLAPPIKDLALALVEWSFADGDSAADLASFKSFLRGYIYSIDRKYTPDAYDLTRWIEYACLSDAATYIADSIVLEKAEGVFDINQIKELKSYMLSKARYFKSINLEDIFKEIR